MTVLRAGKVTIAALMVAALAVMVALPSTPGARFVTYMEENVPAALPADAEVGDVARAMLDVAYDFVDADGHDSAAGIDLDQVNGLMYAYYSVDLGVGSPVAPVCVVMPVDGPHIPKPCTDLS